MRIATTSTLQSTELFSMIRLVTVPCAAHLGRMLDDAERARRGTQTGDLQDWAKELQALGQMLWDNDAANGWSVPIVRRYPDLHVPVMVGGKEWCRFSRDEHGLIGVWGNGEPQRYATAQAAFDDAVKRRKILRLG